MARLLWIIVAVLVVLWLAGTVIGFLGDIIHGERLRVEANVSLLPGQARPHVSL